MSYFRLYQVINVVTFLTAVAMGQDSDFLTNAYNQVQAGLKTTSSENFWNKSNRMNQVVHENGPSSVYIAERSNFIMDFANFFNSKSFEDMKFDNFKKLTEELQTKIDEVCPDVRIQCRNVDSTYRTINGVCNNEYNPRWGSSKVAQVRLLPAVWENTALIPVTLSPNKPLVALDPLGIRRKFPLIFHVKDRTTVQIILLRQSTEKQYFKSCSNNACTVDGLIIDVEADKNTGCNFGDGFYYDGNQVKTTCTCGFTVIYQPTSVKVTLNTADLGRSKIEVASTSLVVHAEPNHISDEELFWITHERGYLIVGVGSECDVTSELIRAKLKLWTVKKRFSLAATSLTEDTEITFPIRNILQVVTDENDDFAGHTKNLNVAPWIYTDGSLLFGTTANSRDTMIITLRDTNNRVTVEVLLGPNARIKATFADGTTQVADIVNYRRGRESFKPSTGRAIGRAYWISWLGNRVYTGNGNIIGKNPYNPILAMSLSTGTVFTVDDVQVSSTSTITWIFDIVQRNVPRQTSVTGRKLPTARDVSLLIHSNQATGVTDTTWSDVLTMSAFQWGQFLDHDIIATPTEEEHECCTNTHQIKPDAFRFCFPIEITERSVNGQQGSFPYPEHTCMSMVRSAAIISCEEKERDLRNRDVMNVITSFIDGSNVYGSEPDTAKKLRGEDGISAYLLTGDDTSRELPTEESTVNSGEGACDSHASPKHKCRFAGDFRSQEQPLLAAMHTVFMREHNRLVDGLIKAGWPGETAEEKEILYQEARRIVIAQIQVITYKEYLASFMDSKILRKYGARFDYKCWYNKRKNPTVSSEFGIAYRFGHTWIPNLLGNVPLVDNFFNPDVSYSAHGSDSVIPTLLKQCPNTDVFLEDVALNLLFGHLDLAALNIQRGRDHGVATWYQMRKKYRLKLPQTFDDMVTMDIASQETVDRLKQTYDCVTDIDLFTGVLIEKPLEQVPRSGSNSAIGELLNHILAEFFGEVKCGDRFWFQGKAAGFNKDQMKALSETSLARVLCHNTNIENIQPNVFMVQNNQTNALQSCNCAGPLSSLDLALFRPRKRGLVLDDEEELEEVDEVDREINEIEELEEVEQLLDELNQIEEEL